MAKKQKSRLNKLKAFYNKNVQGVWIVGTFVAFVIFMWLLGADLLNIITTSVFCGGMGWLFSYDLQHHKYNQSWYPTIGMLGTFVGIWVGLYGLDITDGAAISASLPNLLDGLKLAFITSIVGLVFSMLRKAFDSLGWNKIVEIDPLEESLKAIDENTKQFDDENTIVAQLKAFNKTTQKISENTRQFNDENVTISEQLTILCNEFTKFAGKVTDTATKQFSDALGDIAGDLNNKLSQQFGANFKEFGVSVGKLIEWQQQNKEDMASYRQSLEEYTNVYNEKLALLTNAAEGVKSIVEQTDAEIVKLTKNLIVLDEVGDKAKDLLPAVQSVLDETKSAISGVREVSDAVVDSAKEISDKATKTLQDLVQQNIAELSGMISTASQKMDNGITELVNNTDKRIAKFIEERGTQYQNTVDNVQTALSNVYGNVNKINKQLGEAGGYIAAAMAKMGDDIYKMHNSFEDKMEGVTHLSQRVDVLEKDVKTKSQVKAGTK